MKNICLVQADLLRKLPTGYTAFLPYAAGALWSYAKQSPQIAESYALREIFFLREPVDEVAARMEEPFLVGFSCSSWNTEYSKALARAVKRRFPDCHILFGGHNVPPGAAMLEELPYVDFLIHGEGELGFQALLIELCKQKPDFMAVPGLSYRTGHCAATNPEAALPSVADVSSPYLEGIFDPIVAAHPEIEWSAVWETNRGCPNCCAFCDWGQHKARVRQFSMERLTAEIEWLSANNVGYILCADANFGILPRDEAILDALIAARGRTGLPRYFNCNTTKTINEHLFRIIQKLNDSGLERVGPNFAMQSLSPVVLRNIGRKNLDEETVSLWIRRCRRAGYRTHTDLILGLPGETLQSFCEGVGKLFALGQHEGVQCFPCNLLPNAPMADPAYREKHQIRTERTVLRQVLEQAPEAQPIDEYIDMVTETAAMSRTDLCAANDFMALAQGAHCFGLLRLIAMALHTEKLVSYTSFYLALLDFCHTHPDTLPGEVMSRIREPEPLHIPGFSFGRMAEAQYFFGRAVLEPERFYADIEHFLRRFDLNPELLRYQRESILLPASCEKALEFGYDFPAYFSAIYDGEPVPLQKKAVRLCFSVSWDFSSTEKYYDTIVQAGRYSSNAFYRTEYLDNTE